MTTAALLLAQGNPYMVEYWLRNYERVWENEVDELRVLLNMPAPNEAVLEYICDRVEARDGIFMGYSVGQGASLRALIESTLLDVVMLCEPDCHVRHPGEVAARFKRVKNATGPLVIGSPRGDKDRGFISPELRSVAQRKFSLGSEQPGMWPAFVFAPTEALLATNRDYGPTSWRPGDQVAGLDWTAAEQEESDTFGACAFQLRAACTVEHERQHIVLDDCEWWLDQGLHLPWYHICSLAFSYDFCEDAKSQQDFVRGSDSERFEWSHRLYWCNRFLRKTPGELPEFREIYERNLNATAEMLDVSPAQIGRWEGLADRLVTWDERRA